MNRYAVLLLVISTLTACTAPREYAVHTSIPAPNQVKTEGIGVALSTRSTLQQRPYLSPSANIGWTSTRLLTLGLGMDIGILLDERSAPSLQLPIPIMLSAGFDILQLGCQNFTVCHSGTAGTHAEVALLLYTKPQSTRHLALTLGADQDVRFGPRSNTSFTLGVRFIPNIHRED